MKALTYKVQFFVKESCQDIVEVVSPNGDNQAYAQRVNSDSYTVPTLGYTRSQDLAPYGGLLQPDGFPNNPATWPLMSVEVKNVSQFSGATQARGGTPYSCDGPCGDIACTTDGSSCLNSLGNLDMTKVNQCQRDNDGDGNPDGQCVGVASPAASNRGTQSYTAGLQTSDPNDPTTNQYFAQERLRRLFPASRGIWRWDGSNYVLVSGAGWEPPTQVCAGDPPKRDPQYPNDYCAIPPDFFCDPSLKNKAGEQICGVDVNNDGKIDRKALFLNSTDDTLNVSGGSGLVTIKFNSKADAEQVPLQSIAINWGDTVDSFNFPYAPRTDPSNPHIFSHAYTIKPGATDCHRGGTGATECDYHIKIQIKDNWGWASEASGGTNSLDSSQWIDSGLTVHVE